MPVSRGFQTLSKERDMLNKTSLHDVNLGHGAKMREMFGYYLPWEYAPGHAAEHLGTRLRASLCDLDYMGVFTIEGAGAVDLVQKLCVNDYSKQPVGGVRYTAICSPEGNMIDDGTVWRVGKTKFMVITGDEGDFAWITKNAEGFKVTTENITAEHATLALQGPKSKHILSKVTGVDLDGIRYYHFAKGKVAGIDGLVARMGYTGESGFEMHCPAKHAAAMWTAIMKAGADIDIVPCGQAALESLRQEAGYILVGNDHNKSTNPFEAGIGWTVKFGKKDFNGKQALREIVRQGVKRRLVWFSLAGGEIAKTGDKIFSGDKEIGNATSGSYSPTFKAGTAMGYVAPQYAIPGVAFEIEIDGKRRRAKLSVMPPYDPGNWLTICGPGKQKA
jgi:aminomethyltransferase